MISAEFSYALDAAPEWGFTQYNELAAKIAEGAPSKFVLVLIGRDGAFTQTKVYGSRAEMTKDWDENYYNKLPANVGFALIYDKTDPDPDFRVVEQTLNPTAGFEKRIRWKKFLPWVITGTLAVASVVYLTREREPKKRHVKGKKR